jgi:predicted nuclease of predicted toxin-antitoxin system
VKILIDMNLTPRWAGLLSGRGIEAVHWSTIGAPDAEDTAIMTYARENGYMVLTRDLDFSAILASTQGDKPRVIQNRTANAWPESIFEAVFQSRVRLTAELENGAIVTVDLNKTRLHILPLQ